MYAFIHSFIIHIESQNKNTNFACFADTILTKEENQTTQNKNTHFSVMNEQIKKKMNTNLKRKKKYRVICYFVLTK